MGLEVSDQMLGTFVPIVVYWVCSGIYTLFGSFNNYRLHSRKEEDEENLVPKGTVFRGVLIQQAAQAIVATMLYTMFGDNNNSDDAITTSQTTLSSLILLIRQFLTAMIVLDTWQYFMHRYMHQNKFLYHHIHSHHHRLVIPYAFGALYNHPLEGLILDTIGGALSFLASGMSPRASIFFFSFATAKNVDDHCGMLLPWNVFRILFRNNTAYHDVHHQLYGSKYNFSQPFFVMWDRMLGTYLPYELVRRGDGSGFEAIPTKEYKDE